MDWDKYSFIVSGKYRKAVLLALEVERTPSQIAKATKLNASHVSRALAEFEKKKIVRCLTPKAKLGRVYGLTKEGKEFYKHLKKSEA